MTKTLAVVLVGVAVLSGCERAIPAGFWVRFPNADMTPVVRRNGPRGGWTVTSGSSHGGEAIYAQQIKAFAADNGWKFVSEQWIPDANLKTWVNSAGKPIFPLGYNGFIPGRNDRTYDRFPRSITTHATLLVFESGWITSMGGVQKPAYGYVLLSDDGQALSVYHLWGE